MNTYELRGWDVQTEHLKHKILQLIFKLGDVLAFISAYNITAEA